MFLNFWIGFSHHSALQMVYYYYLIIIQQKTALQDYTTNMI